ncbi:putative outer membrane protein y4fJ precursor [Pseudovibrio sp. Ad46]|uniref:porin n=1 Tax=unclassified Pseudovibrio TaxID=2627060 RepID=UPI0007AE40C3|nr:MULTISPECIES: porin [unclassified Pseudovibrio]KZK80153.1 putative outer membrane protein y4fJ precursor [Pseudovibrio sp. Ad46]KZK99446.1 putative outer membrane protein y4fJ precursor [Pseudovibrio sp. Ad5]
MNFKKIAIAAAAAATATPAMAADLPVVAEPVNYVQACDAFGAGYFQLPGQDTCIRVHGRIRTNFTTHDLTKDYSTAANAYDAYARGYIYLESMTDTEFASIKTYTELTATWNDDKNDDGDQGVVGLGNAYLQLGFDNVSVLIGRSGGVFDPFGGYSEIGTVGPVAGGEDVLQISATADLGNGITASFGILDSDAYGGATKDANFEAGLSMTQGMFSASVFAAAHAYSNDDYGFAVAGQVEASVSDSVKVGFGAAYADSASSYIGGTHKTGASDADGVTGYNLVAGLEAGLSDKVTAALDVSYSALDQDDEDFSKTTVNGSVVYSPVAGLKFVLDGGVARDSDDGEEAKISTRVQYSF